MLKKIIALVGLTLSLSANSTIVDLGTITRDTTTGLDWLDVTETQGLSYNEVVAQMVDDGAYEGWRYALTAEVGSFFDAFGGSGIYQGWSVENNGLYGRLSELWGTTVEGYTWGMTGEVSGTFIKAFQVHDMVAHLENTGDSIRLDYGDGYRTYLSNVAVGSALVRDVISVPVPATVYLFGSVLIYLAGIKRKK